MPKATCFGGACTAGLTTSIDYDGAHARSRLAAGTSAVGSPFTRCSSACGASSCEACSDRAKTTQSDSGAAPRAAAVVLLSCLPHRHAHGWRRIFSGMRSRLAVGLCTLLCAAGAGAATITTVVNSDPAMCARLLEMIKAARIPEMTDRQLCEFDFSQLPPTVTKGFTFPHWRRLDVADGPALYVKMLHANRAPGSVATEPNYAKERQHAEEATRLGVLAFYTTQIPISAVTLNASYSPPTAGSDRWTILSMRQTQCPSPVDRWMVGRYGDYSIFEGPEMATPVPINVAAGGSQLAMWNGKLVQLYVAATWLKLGSGPPSTFVALDNFWWSLRMGGTKSGTGMWGGTHCSFSIDKQEQE